MHPDRVCVDGVLIIKFYARSGPVAESQTAFTVPHTYSVKGYVDVNLLTDEIEYQQVRKGRIMSQDALESRYERHA